MGSNTLSGEITVKIDLPPFVLLICISFQYRTPQGSSGIKLNLKTFKTALVKSLYTECKLTLHPVEQ